MYYKGMWEELKKEINSKNKKVTKKKQRNKKIIKRMEELENRYNDYGEMNKYCPKCGNLMITKKGKYGYFRGCSNFPKCNYHEFFREFGTIKDNKNINK